VPVGIGRISVEGVWHHACSYTCLAASLPAYLLLNCLPARSFCLPAVVPVATPNDTSEPQLLSMSPEQVGSVHSNNCRLHFMGDCSWWGTVLLCACMSRHTTRLYHVPVLFLPIQAEETAAKLRELESDMLLRRQESRRGCNLCGCFVITLASDTLPEHLRVWEMTLM
jgi:hypothetical protein